MTFRTIYTGKAIKTIKDIIKSEDLTATYSIEENAIGDTIIAVKGNKEEIITLRDIYNMVSR